jgi:hypothetical protein
MEKQPFLIVVYPPPEEWRGHRLEFAKQLMEKLKANTGDMPHLVRPDTDFFCLLVNSHIRLIDGALHHACDNKTQYLVVQTQTPIANCGLAGAEAWIRGRLGP